MNLPIPMTVLYIGLGGTVLALIVATIQQKWSCKVFFLLALRLAIGWQFLFEGLYKVNSYYVGPTETNRPFSSEPYFRNAPGPIAAYMRHQFDDPTATISAKVKPTKEMTPEMFAKLTVEQQAEACPESVAKELAALQEKAEAAVKADAEKELKAGDAAETKALKDITDAAEKALKEAKTDDEKEKINAKTKDDQAKAKANAEKAWQAARKKIDTAQTNAAERITAAKAAYARWVFGVDGRPAKVKFVSGDVALTAPQRIEHLDWLRKEVKAADDRLAARLGNGSGTEQKHAAELRTDLITAESDIAKDANAFVAELKKDLNGGKAVEEPATETRGQLMDKVTMWFLVGVGACLMAGLFTRLACLFAAGFLIVTYLTYPPFPWYPLPPNTEGNPIFINKNIIECLALLALACMPTGRWLGLDAIVLRPFCRYKGEGETPDPK